jgi:hypothetical protein
MKVLLYCTKAKPYLYHTYRLINNDNEVNYFELSNKKLPLEEKHIIRDLLNGKVVASFEWGGYEKIKYGRWVNHKVGDWNYRGYQDEKLDTFKKACLTEQQIIDYGKGKDLYAWHIDNLKVFDEPIELGELVNYNKCLDPLCDIAVTRAPRSFMYVWWKGEKCLLLNTRPQYVYDIIEERKTVEIRKNVPKEVR